MILGPDGFSYAPGNPHVEFHSALNELLQAQAKEPGQSHATAAVGIARLRRKCSDEEMIALTFAAVERTVSNGELDEHSAAATGWRWRPISILYHLYALGLPFTASEICRLIDSRHGAAPPSAVWSNTSGAATLLRRFVPHCGGATART